MAGAVSQSNSEGYLDHHDIAFYYHPAGTCLEGYPHISGIGRIRVVDETDFENTR